MGLFTGDKFTELCPTLSGALTAAQISHFAAAAELAAGRYVGFPLESRTETISLDGSGHPDQVLPRHPVSSVYSVYLDRAAAHGQNPDGAFAAETLLTQGTHYTWTRDGRLTVLALPSGWWGLAAGGTSWPVGRFGRWGFPGLSAPGGRAIAWPAVPGCVRVTYTAGFTAADADLVAALAQMASYAALTTETGGLLGTSVSYIDVSETVGFIGESLRGGNVPALGSARATLDAIREPRLAFGLY
jgi:hypothetical protein